MALGKLLDEIDRVVDEPADTEMVAVALALEEAALVAVTMAVVELVTVGAVNNPLVETVPAVVLQRTCVFVEP